LTATVGTAYGPYSFTATVPTGETASPTFAVASGQLPAGVTLDPTSGALSGTPTGEGPYTFTIETENAANGNLGATLTITVAGTPMALGTMLIAEPFSNQVVEVPPGGSPQTTVGTGLLIPSAVAVDSAGDVFIADTRNNRVVEVEPDGTQTTVASGLKNPDSVAVDSEGDLFIADTGHNRIVEVPSGGMLKVFDKYALNQPTGVTVDAAGDVFVANLGDNQVVEEPAAGGARTVVGTGLLSPRDLAVDSTGNVYVGDLPSGSTGAQVLEIPPGGPTAVPQVLSTGFSAPVGLALDSTGDLFVADSENNQVDELTNTAGWPQSTAVSGLDQPVGLAVYVPAPVFRARTGPPAATVGTAYSYSVPASTPAGEQAPTFAVTSGTLPSGLTLDPTTSAITGTPTFADTFTFDVVAENDVSATAPAAITITVGPSTSGLPAQGTIYATDFGNRVVEMAPDGSAQKTVNTGKLQYPAAVAVNAANDLYVAFDGCPGNPPCSFTLESGGVEEIAPNGTRTLIANGTYKYPVYDPSGVAVDNKGDVFIADFGDNDVVEVAADGIETLLDDDTPGAFADPCDEPSGVAVDAAGDVYIACLLSGVIKITPNGTEEKIAPDTFDEASGVVVDAQGDVFVSDFGDNALWEVPAGQSEAQEVLGGYLQPTDVTLDSAGDLFMPTEDGLLEDPSSEGRPFTLGTLTEPTGVAVYSPGPTFSADTPPTSGAEGTAYSYQYIATAPSGDPTTTYAVASGALPPGVTLNATTGVISGTPTAAGNFTFVIEAESGSVFTPAPSATIGVTGPPLFTQDGPPSTAAGDRAFSYPFHASGLPAPTYAIGSGSVPTGLELNATTGVLSGTPSKVAAFTFTITASNGISPDASTPSITIRVTDSSPLFINDTPRATTVEGSSYSYTFSASGIPAPTFSFSGELPPGLSLKSNGVLSGKTTKVGRFTFLVIASNGISPNADTARFSVTVTSSGGPKR
jgi:sugar lactone lactonase YvrE